MILPGRRPSGSNPPIRQAEPPGDALPFVKNESVDHPVHPLRRSRCLFRRRNARADIKLPRPVPAKNARTRAGTLGCWLIRETGKTIKEIQGDAPSMIRAVCGKNGAPTFEASVNG